LGHLGFVGNLLYLDYEGRDFVLCGNAFGILKDLALNIGSVAPDVLKVGGRLFELALLSFFLGALFICGKVLLP
jgi:hypothetical protein